MTATTVGGIPTLSAGDFLRKAREYAGMSQGELATRLGLDPKTVGDHERDVRPMRAERVVAWATATGVDPAWLQWNVDACNSLGGGMEFDLRVKVDSKPRRYPFGGRGVNGLDVVNHRLTTDRRSRDAWVLAA